MSRISLHSAEQELQIKGRWYWIRADQTTIKASEEGWKSTSNISCRGLLNRHCFRWQQLTCHGVKLPSQPRYGWWGAEVNRRSPLPLCFDFSGGHRIDRRKGQASFYSCKKSRETHKAVQFSGEHRYRSHSRTWPSRWPRTPLHQAATGHTYKLRTWRNKPKMVVLWKYNGKRKRNEN